MRYMLMIAEDEALYEGEAGQKLLMDVVAKHMALGAELRAAGIEWSGAGLQPAATATTVRNADGSQSLHDGPFAETKEQLGGFYLIDVPDLDAALAWARKIPTPGKSSVEVRPVAQY
jgi:hypothetical protein